MQFSEVYGHQEVKQKLIKSVQNQHVAHAQLFVSESGGANLAMALAFATYVNCENVQDGDSCGVCDSCRKMNKLAHPDLHLILPVSTSKAFPKTSDAVSKNYVPQWRKFIAENPYTNLQDWAKFYGAESKQPIISKENAKAIVSALNLKAYEAKYKIMLVWLPETMYEGAANAILKILEEPPENTIFLLVSNSIESLLLTIKSRTQMLVIPRYDESDVKEILLNSCEVDEQRASFIASITDGNIQLARELALEKDAEDEYREEKLFPVWMRYVYGRSFIELDDLAAKYAKFTKAKQRRVLLYALGIMRDCMMYKFSSEDLIKRDEEQLAFVSKFSSIINEVNLPLVTNVLDKGITYLERNASPKMVFMGLSIELASIFRIKAD